MRAVIFIIIFLVSLIGTVVVYSVGSVLISIVQYPWNSCMLNSEYAGGVSIDWMATSITPSSKMIPLVDCCIQCVE